MAAVTLWLFTFFVPLKFQDCSRTAALREILSNEQPLVNHHRRKRGKGSEAPGRRQAAVSRRPARATILRRFSGNYGVLATIAGDRWSFTAHLKYGEPNEWSIAR